MGLKRSRTRNGPSCLTLILSSLTLPSFVLLSSTEIEGTTSPQSQLFEELEHSADLAIEAEVSFDSFGAHRVKTPPQIGAAQHLGDAVSHRSSVFGRDE
jgi:hypothetical protein